MNLRLTCGIPVALAIILALAYPACARGTNDEDIRVVMFRVLLAPESESGEPRKKSMETLLGPKDAFKPRLLFLSVKDKNPSPVVLQRVRQDRTVVRNGFTVKDVSHAVYDKTLPDRFEYCYRDKETDEIGVIYDVGPIKRLGRSRVRLRAGYHAGLLHGRSAVYTLALKRGRWVVVAVTDVIVS